MKTRFCVLGILQLLLFSMVMQTAFTRKVCAVKNPFIRKLSESGVQIYTEPKLKQAKLCSSEWGVHASCCEVESTSIFITRRRQENELAFKDMQKEVENLDLNIKSFLDLRMKDVNTPVDLPPRTGPPSMASVNNYFMQRTLHYLKQATIELISLLGIWKQRMIDENQ